MIRSRNLARPGFKFTGLAAAGMFVLSACANQSPESVCGSPETITAVRGLLLDTMARGSNVDGSAFEEAFAQMATIDLITFEGRDDETRIIRCRAQVRTIGTSSQFAIDFSRQPTVDTGFVYSVEFDGTDAWNALGMGLVPRAKAIARSRLGSPGDAATTETSDFSALEEAPQGSTTMHQSQDVDGNWPGEPGFTAAPEQILTPATPRATAPVVPPVASAPPPTVSSDEEIMPVGPAVITRSPSNPEGSSVRSLPSVISDPEWARAPTPEFPERAKARGIQRGTVALNCEIQANGSLTDCAVTSEAPAGAGFAQAALAAARRARVSARAVDRVSPGGRTLFAVQIRDGVENR